jgi:hypothetical protein
LLLSSALNFTISFIVFNFPDDERLFPSDNEYQKHSNKK